MDQTRPAPIGDDHGPAEQARPAQNSGLLHLPPGSLALADISLSAPRQFPQPCLVSPQLLSTAPLFPHLLSKLLCPEQKASCWSWPTAWSLSDSWVFHLPYPVLGRFAQSSTSFNFSPVLCPTLDLLEQLVPRAAKGELGFTAQLCASCPESPGMEFHGSQTYDLPSLFLDVWFCCTRAFHLQC